MANFVVKFLRMIDENKSETLTQTTNTRTISQAQLDKRKEKIGGHVKM